MIEDLWSELASEVPIRAVLREALQLHLREPRLCTIYRLVGQWYMTDMTDMTVCGPGRTVDRIHQLHAHAKYINIRHESGQIANKLSQCTEPRLLFPWGCSHVGLGLVVAGLCLLLGLGGLVADSLTSLFGRSFGVDASILGFVFSLGC